MRALSRIGGLMAIVMLMSVALFGCGGGDDQTGSDGTSPTAAQTQTTATDSGPDQTQAPTTSTEGGAPVETEVIGMPDGFPSDVPVHPGTVTAYDPMEVTETTTVHQLTVESAASFDDVVAWYETQLPAGWSVGFLEKDGDKGSREGKIALNGGAYAPASPEGMGGGVIIGVFEGGKTQIVTTVTVMAP